MYFCDLINFNQKMKKIIYVLLTIGVIINACKKEEENNNPPTSPASIVGIWTPTSVDIDTAITVTIMGMVIDSLSGSGSMTLTPEEADFDGDFQFTSDGKMLVIEDVNEADTLEYIYSNNILTITDDDTTFSVPCSFTKTNLSITIEQSMDTAFTENGIPFTISAVWTQIVHFSRNTIISYPYTNQRLGNETKKNHLFDKRRLNTKGIIKVD